MIALAFFCAATVSLGDPIAGFTTPVDLVNAGDGSKRIFVVQQDGLVKVVEHGKITGTFLDAAKLLGRVGGEQGLLGLAFHPKFKDNGRYYIAYTDAQQNDAVAELKSGADASTAKVLFAIKDFAPNHNGGGLAFGPDGLLYVGTGDGGGAGDPHRTAQDPDVWLGKMLKVDVDTGAVKVAFKGLRNPWRYAFDKKTGDLWIGDVGQDTWEEVDFVAHADLDKPLNFGWSCLEGTHAFRGKCTGTVAPVFEYKHGADGCSVTGGVVVSGAFYFGDFCSGRIWAASKDGAGKVLDAHIAISSFGVDEDGGAWVVDYAGAVRPLQITP